MYDRLSARCFMPYPEVPVPHAKEGPLTGLTFAVKDIFDVAGYPTSAGNPTFLALQGIKQKTASCVEKLLAAGAEFQGKTITDAGKKLITSAQQAERALLRDIISDDISDEAPGVIVSSVRFNTIESGTVISS